MSLCTRSLTCTPAPGSLLRAHLAPRGGSLLVLEVTDTLQDCYSPGHTMSEARRPPHLSPVWRKRAAPGDQRAVTVRNPAPQADTSSLTCSFPRLQEAARATEVRQYRAQDLDETQRSGTKEAEQLPGRGTPHTKGQVMGGRPRGGPAHSPSCCEQYD